VIVSAKGRVSPPAYAHDSR